MMSMDAEITLTDAERLLVINFVIEKWAKIRNNEGFTPEIKECESIIKKMSGVDKRVYIKTVR